MEGGAADRALAAFASGRLGGRVTEPDRTRVCGPARIMLADAARRSGDFGGLPASQASLAARCGDAGQ
jgi:hypothetical protein